MREPNRPSSSANSNPSGGQQPPNYPPTQSTPANPQGVRASFTVVAPQGGMPHGHTLPPPTVARVASQSMSSGQQPPQLHPHQPMSPQQQQIENLLHVLSANDGTPRVDLKLQQLKVGSEFSLFRIRNNVFWSFNHTSSVLINLLNQNHPGMSRN